MIRALLRPLLICLLLPGAALAVDPPKVTIESVTSPGGITAWLWRDETVPVISIQAAARGGSRLDPKPGVSRLINGLTGTTAGNYDPVGFVRQFESLSASLAINRTPAYDQISIRMIRDKRDDSADLIALSLTQRVIPDAAILQGRTTLKRQLQADQRQPGVRAEQTLAALFLGDQVPMITTPLLPRVDDITRDDMMAVSRDRLTRANLSVAVAGAISPAELAPLLDRLFGKLPPGEVAPPLPTFPERPQPGFYHVPVPGAPQSSLVTVLPGLDRRDADFWPAAILEHVLGGATFTSRLKIELREKRGMVYSTGSALRYGGLRPTWVTTAAMAPGRVAEAIAITKRLWAELRDGGITQDELDAARDYYLGASIVSLTSTGAMADFVGRLQLDGLPPTYYDDRRALLAGLTLERVNAVAKRLIDPDALVIIAAGETTPDLPPSSPLPPGF